MSGALTTTTVPPSASSRRPGPTSPEASRSRYDLALDSYQEGLQSLLDLLQAQSALSSARSKLVGSSRDVYVALAILSHAAGRLSLTTWEGFLPGIRPQPPQWKSQPGESDPDEETKPSLAPAAVLGALSNADLPGCAKSQSRNRCPLRGDGGQGVEAVPGSGLSDVRVTWYLPPVSSWSPRSRPSSAEVHFIEGDQVKTGDVLFTIETDTYQARWIPPRPVGPGGSPTQAGPDYPGAQSGVIEEKTDFPAGFRHHDGQCSRLGRPAGPGSGPVGTGPDQPGLLYDHFSGQRPDRETPG